MRFLTVNSWCHMEVCSRSQYQHMKMTFDQRFLFWRKEHKECGCHWTNGVVSMVYKSARPWTDIQDRNLTENCNRGNSVTLYWILAATGNDSLTFWSLKASCFRLIKITVRCPQCKINPGLLDRLQRVSKSPKCSSKTHSQSFQIRQYYSHFALTPSAASHS